MSKLKDLVGLAKGWKYKEGGESGCIGSWILEVLESAEYDEFTPKQQIELVEASMEEIKSVADYVLKSLK